MTRRRPRVAILGGGMGGLATAWRLSEPGSREQVESITVYQRDWRLGGKGASSRGVHGRIEEHGLHIWLGYYENAFRLIRECYEALDREHSDPDAPIKTWTEAFVPAPHVGLEEQHLGGWQEWLGDFSPNEQLPGEPGAPAGVMTVTELAERFLRLLRDFTVSLPGRTATVTLSTDRTPSPSSQAGLALQARTLALASALEALTISRDLRIDALDETLGALRQPLLDAADSDPGLRRAWHLISVVVATLRGVVADGVLTDPKGFRRLNDEDYRDWILRHGGAPEAARSTLVTGLYDLVFAHQDADPERASFGAGWGVFLSGKTFFDYKGSIFWKMRAGMGDVVFAPLYQALRLRGVEFEFFHRVEALRLAPDRLAIDAIDVVREARCRDGVPRYEPLVRVKGLPCFPAGPIADQLDAGARPEPITLRRGTDFDVAVLAIPLGMAPQVCEELIADRPEWRAMIDNVRTVATQAFQVWLRDDTVSLGATAPATTFTGYVKPFDTWASMPQTLDAEDWPAHDQPRSVEYFCSTLDAPLDTVGVDYGEVVRDERGAIPVARCGTPPAGGSARRRVSMGPAVRQRWGRGARGVRESVLDRERRSLRSLRAVRGRQRQVPTPARRERLRQPLPRGRLDRLRPERRVHRGRGAVGPTSGQRRHGSLTALPHRRALPRLIVPAGRGRFGPEARSVAARQALARLDNGNASLSARRPWTTSAQAGRRSDGSWLCSVAR